MDQDRIWDYFQNEDVEHGCAGGGRHAYIADRIASGSRVLNVGVGSGRLEALLGERGALASALDPNEKTISRLRAQLDLGDRARVGYANAMPFDDAQFDCVVMSEVLEHLDESTLETALGEVRRVLAPTGRFLGTVPADENLEVSRVVCPRCGETFHRWGHVRSFSRGSLTELLVGRFQDVVVKRVVLDDPLQLNWKGRIASRLRQLQAAMDLPSSSQNFFFEATRS